MATLQYAVRRNRYGMPKLSAPREFGRKNTRASSSKKITHIAKLNKPGRLEELSPKILQVDPQVQRELNEKRVDDMAADFRPESLGLIIASKRVDGRYYILDGMHRVMAARKANWGGLFAVRVFEGLTLDEEAGLFLTHNATKKVEAIDRYKVRITMGDPVAVSINNVLKHYGLHVDWATNKAINTLSAIVTLEKVYHGIGILPQGEYPELLDRVMKTITTAYGSRSERTAFSRSMIEGLGIVHAHFGKRINNERLNQAMASLLPQQVQAQARDTRDRMGGTIGEASADVIHRLYNKQKGFSSDTRLPNFIEVDPRNQVMPEDDPLYVDPAQYVMEFDEEPKDEKVGA